MSDEQQIVKPETVEIVPLRLAALRGEVASYGEFDDLLILSII